MKQPGTLFIISGPSGGGKTSLVHALRKARPEIQLSISYTTRAARSQEQPGVHYHFVTQEVFQEMIQQGKFLEYAEIFGHYYGTAHDWLKTQLASGQSVILEIDWQGAAEVRKYYADAVSIFILPPNEDTLRERLRLRAQDDPKVVTKRVENAKREIMHYTEYDYLIMNDRFEVALMDLTAIVQSALLRTALQRQTYQESLHAWTMK